MEVVVNWTAIFAGMATSIVVGMIWYAPGVFGNAWMKAAGLSMKQTQDKQRNGMIAAIVRSFLLSFALFHIIYVTAAFYSNDSFLANALGTGAWISVAIVSAALIMHDTFDQKPMISTRINVGYQIVSILAVAFVIGLIAG